jgi:hypothetical protein
MRSPVEKFGLEQKNNALSDALNAGHRAQRRHGHRR